MQHKEVLFLPAVMIAHQIAMVRKKADKDILRFRSCFDSIKNSSKTMIQIADLPVVSCLYDSCERRVDCICPNGISHEWNFFIEMIFLDAALERGPAGLDLDRTFG